LSSKSIKKETNSLALIPYDQDNDDDQSEDDVVVLRKQKKNKSKEYKELRKLRKLEKELEGKLKDHKKPEKNNWVPYEKKQNEDKKKLEEELKQLSNSIVRDEPKNTRRQYVRKALVGFKQNFIYADEYDNLNGFDEEKHGLITTYLTSLLKERLKK
jgi:hypothetical protein